MWDLVTGGFLRRFDFTSCVSSFNVHRHWVEGTRVVEAMAVDKCQVRVIVDYEFDATEREPHFLRVTVEEARGVPKLGTARGCETFVVLELAGERSTSERAQASSKPTWSHLGTFRPYDMAVLLLIKIYGCGSSSRSLARSLALSLPLPRAVRVCHAPQLPMPL